MKKIHILIASLLPLLAACSSESASNTAEDFPLPIPLAAKTVEVAAKTRADANTADPDNTEGKWTWAGTEKLAVYMESTGSDVFKGVRSYTPDNTGALTANGDAFVFRSPNDPARTCTAWYEPTATNGYTETAPDGQVISVATDQSTDYKGSDFLYAAPTTIAYKHPMPTYNLLFTHQMAWLTFIVGSDDAAKQTITAATVGTKDAKVITAATFSAPTGETTSTGATQLFGSYSTTNDQTGVITPYTNTKPSTEGIIARYDAIVVPQTMDQTNGQTLFTVTIGDKTYKYTSKMQFNPGLHYTFNLKIVFGTELLVLVHANNWGPQDKEIGMESQDVKVTLWTGGT